MSEANGVTTDHGRLVMPQKELRGYPKREKKARSQKRKLAGYCEDAPEMCSNCIWHERSLLAKSVSTVRKSEYFPPRCKKHEFEVLPHAVCDNYTAE